LVHVTLPAQIGGERHAGVLFGQRGRERVRFAIDQHRMNALPRPASRNTRISSLTQRLAAACGLQIITRCPTRSALA
jgi:hypothetical protein